MFRKIFVKLFDGWMCEIGHYHFDWEENHCCWEDSTIGIIGIFSLKRKGKAWKNTLRKQSGL